jgi:deoxyribonucleoside regulator
MLTNFFFVGMTMDVARAPTTASVSRNLASWQLTESRVVQLNGAGNTLNTFTNGGTDSGDILRRFGEAYGVTVEQFPGPAFFHDSSAKETMWGIRGFSSFAELPEEDGAITRDGLSPEALGTLQEKINEVLLANP